LCRIYHPDRPQGDETKFLRVQEYYENKDIINLLNLTNKDTVLEIIKEGEIEPLYKTVKNQTSVIQKDINEIKSNMIWVWATAPASEKVRIKAKIIGYMRQQI
jgi:hypothetical protein